MQILIRNDPKGPAKSINRKKVNRAPTRDTTRDNTPRLKRINPSIRKIDFLSIRHFDLLISIVKTKYITFS